MDNFQIKSQVISKLLMALFDMSLCAISLWLAISLRLDTWVTWNLIYLKAVITSIFLLQLVFYAFGIYKEIIEHLEFQSLLKILNALLFYLYVYICIFLVAGVNDIPRSIGVVQPILLIVLILISRIIYYYLMRLSSKYTEPKNRPNIVIYGFGVAGRQLIAAIAIEKIYNVIAVLDDNIKLVGNSNQGIPIVCLDDFPGLKKKFNIETVILAIPSLSHNRRIEIIDYFQSHSVHVQSLPELFSLKNLERVRIDDVQELQPKDFLGRPIVEPVKSLMYENINNQTVMVIGAGGSIGREICKQAFLYEPKKLILIDSSEYSLYVISQDLLKIQVHVGSKIEIIPLLANMTIEDSINRIIKRWIPDVIFHAAAYKHVPLVEENIIESIRNNVFGALNCIKCANKYKVSNFILISSDKAVRPANIMGVTKRIVELIVKFYTNKLDSKTKFSIVRFGNVLDSSGSVVPLFREQIKNGGPVTVTHMDVTRFFMTISEAAQLVIQASALLGKSGSTYILDMGKPILIYDLAKRMIEFSGKRVVDSNANIGEIEIKVTGLRPGEKLFEELFLDGNLLETQHPLIFMLDELSIGLTNEFEELLQGLQNSLDLYDLRETFFYLQLLVPEYTSLNHPVDLFYENNI